MENKRTILEDLKTHDRIHEHLSNKSDVISDEDIQNAKTDGFEEEPGDVNNEAGNGNDPAQKKSKSNEKDGDADSGMVTPWNILGA